MGTANNHDIPSESKGIIPRAISTLFKTMNSSQLKSRKFSIKVSFIEIYNEDLIDLLGDNIGIDKPQVTIREDSKGNIIWNGLQEIRVNGVEEVMSHLSRGSQNRQVGATDMNAQSSRSHAIFSVTMTQFVNSNNPPNSPVSPTSRPSTPSKVRPGSSLRLSRKLDDSDCVSITSKFHFVDLAGSERLKRTSAIGERAKEGISINSGLLALGNVISALGDPTKAKHITHIPYRDSKLTRLLQDSLGGNARTLMIACVSPTESNLTESLNTLKYANRARNIKNSASVNSEEIGWNDLDHLRGLVLKLRREIKSLKTTSLPNGLIDANEICTSGRNTPTMMSGRNTPTMMSGRNTPTMMYGGYGGGSKRSSTSLSIVTNANDVNEVSKSQNDKDIEILEEQLIELQRSYSELSQKYAKTSAELAIHQENMDSTPLNDSSDIVSPTNSKFTSQNSLESITEEVDEELKLANFQKAVEPVIEEYEKSISNLESQLALTRAALTHTETVMQEQESKLAHAEQVNEQNITLINELRLKIGNLSEHESTNEQYIRDLELKLETFVLEQQKDQEMINELKNKIAQLKNNSENSEGYISDLETRLKGSEEQVEKFSKTIERLEKRLEEREAAYLELEERTKYTLEENQKLLVYEIDDRDQRIMKLEKKADDLVHELELLRRLKSHETEFPDCGRSLSPASLEDYVKKPEQLIVATLETKLLNLQETHSKTVTEFVEIKSKYEECLCEIHELQQQLTEVKLCHSDILDSSTPSTPSSPTTPRTPKSRFHNLKSSNNTDRMSLPPTLKLNEPSNNNDTASPKRITHHRRTKSLTAEIKDKEKRDKTHAEIVQKLQCEIKQLELLHRDKSQGLDAIKQEFARLECTHRETLEIVEELKDEIKRRDSLTQSDTSSVTTSECTDYSAATSELDEHEIILRLREEVEHLKEEQRKALELILQQEKENLDKDQEVLRIEANIQNLQEQLTKSSVNKTESVDNNELEQQLVEVQSQDETLKKQQSENNDNELMTLQCQVKKLQAEIEDKSQTIATLLLRKLELEKSIQELEQKLVNAQKESENVEAIKEEIKLLNVLKSEQSLTINQLQAELQETTQAKEQALIELNNLKKDFGAQKELVVTLEGELNQMREELTKSKQDNQDVSKKLEDLSKLLSDALKQRDEGENRIQVLEIQLQELTASNEANEQDVSMLREELFNARHKMGAQNELLAELGTQMMAAEQERDQYLQREKELIMELEAKKTEQKTAVAKFESMISSLQEELAEAKHSSQLDLNTITKLKESLASVELHLDDAKKQDENRSKVVIGLEVKLKETNAAILEKEQLITTKDAFLKELEASTEKAKIQLDNARISEAIESERVNELEVKLCSIQTRLRECVSSELVVEVKVVNPDDNLSNNPEYVELKASLIKVKAELEEAKAAAAEQTNLIQTLELQIREAEKCRDEASTKVKDASEEINRLKEQCINLKTELDDAYKDALIHDFQKVDVSVVEKLNKQLKKARNESKTYQERVDKLEEMTQKLESEKKEKEKANEELQKQVEKLQKELESLAVDFADSAAKYEDTGEYLEMQKKQIDGLDNSLSEIKNIREVYSSPTSETSLNASPALAKLSSTNEILRQTNENLNVKILQAQSRMSILTQKIKSLENELKTLQYVSKDDVSGNSILRFKEKIQELEAEKEGLEQANFAFSEERKKLDQKIDSLLQQLQSVGQGGNEAATHLSELNVKISELENEVSCEKQKSIEEHKEMEKEITRLTEVNQRLEKEMSQVGLKTLKGPLGNVSPHAGTRTQSLDNSIHSKLLRQESTIMQQTNLIKALQDKIVELESRSYEDSLQEISLSSGMFATDLDAVGGFRVSTMSVMSNASDAAKKKRPGVAAIANQPMTPPPTPPPSHPIPSAPPTSGSRSSTPGCGSPTPPTPRIPISSSRPNSRNGLNIDLSNTPAVELTVEIHKLHRKVAKMEGESLENRHHVETLENSLSESETNLRVAKQQLQILQREKMDLVDQIKKLRSQLDETTAQYENAKSSVQEEKKVIETVLEEERKAKESAEKARRQLENRMEELMAKRSKFMCF
ncbi:kinesin-domain-containing protein [Gigaspora margarita]|uniref:Kinesin-domain-containing protein n=1 Tax=Gigaspora margarita TaxID=4874 RepID=A0A8H3XB49_GIGMA|nr:kinesin-domain-containing protein [Gigaspora margarita]